MVAVAAPPVVAPSPAAQRPAAGASGWHCEDLTDEEWEWIQGGSQGNPPGWFDWNSFFFDPLFFGGGPKGQQLHTDPEFVACFVGNVMSGFHTGMGYGFVAGTAAGWKLGGPIALRNGYRAAVVGGAASIEVGGVGAVPAFAGTYVVTRLGFTAVGAVIGTLFGSIGGAIKGGVESYANSGVCPSSLR